MTLLAWAMASHSSTFAGKIPWMEEPGGLQSMGSLKLNTIERLHFHFSLSCIGEGNGNPLQCSCLENPRDGEAWWVALSGVAQSRTRLKRLSSSSSSSISMGDECNCSMVSTFFSTTLLGNWDEDWPFPVVWSLMTLPDLLTYWMQHLDGIIIRVWNSSGIPSHPLALLTAVAPKAHLTSLSRMSGSRWLTTQS